MANTNDFTRLVPGFDFLQNLMKGAGAGIPGMSQWIAPTIDPDELEKRISELKTVQFWLESNARLLATTIQALEVQRMTLSTLQSMNMPLADLRDALKISVPAAAPAKPAAAAEKVDDEEEVEEEEEDDEDEDEDAGSEPSPSAKDKPGARKAAAGKTAASPVVDPMQWWGALTQQFTELATKALKDGAGDSARMLGGAAVKQAANAAAGSLKKAASMPAKAAAGAAKGGSRAAAKKRAR